MILQVLPVLPGLEKYVQAIWYLNPREPAEDRDSFIIMADGCPGMIFQDPESGVITVGDKSLPPLFLYGQATTSANLHIDGKFNAIGILFRPAAIKKIFRIPANIITDSCLSIGELPGAGNYNITDALADCDTLSERLTILSTYLHRELALSKIPDDTIIENAIFEIIQASGNLSLSGLQKRLRITERSLERKFREQVGISARLYARICRFQDSVKQLNDQRYDKLSDIAYHNGYADQSHFIRNFRSFAGCSPNQYKHRSVKLFNSYGELVI